ncbi:efflux RND transporter periplasmic adaptor subunit [Magnetovirga frankeli]|uniref:efflux RND transporter periplasmic adaptor subunit n=1 Tax=Magnetovirga frankeli TaxID=947516 RepID=UPI00129385DD|nr:efflux RND transporter periplasmic adaptor subunit [gamma proteobacterium SS-5]
MPNLHRPLCLAALLAAALALSACQQEAPPEVAAKSRPVAIFQVQAWERPLRLRFPGRVRASQRAELAFNLAGKLVDLPVQEGMQLAAGDLVARLDPAGFETQLAQAEAEFAQAKTSFDRLNSLWQQSQAVAKAELDQQRTQLNLKQVALDAARKELADSQLRAPFAGRVARRWVENHQNVQAKEAIISLQDLSQLEVVIHVPERVVQSQKRREFGYVRFADLAEPDQPVRLKSFASEADPQTQTYEVVLELIPSQGSRVLPGMAVEVLAEGANAGDEPKELIIPLKAVLVEADGQPKVWVVDPETDKVSLRAIQVGDVRDSHVVVQQGLKAGERIASAGIHQLREGMQVRPLP